MVPDLLLAVLSGYDLIQASGAYFNSLFGGILEMPDEVVNGHRKRFSFKELIISPQENVSLLL